MNAFKSVAAGLVSALLVAGLNLSPSQAQETSDTLVALVQVLNETNDPQFQLDILKGLSDALKGRRQVPMPTGWAEIETKLSQSANAEVRTLAQSLSLTFGSTRALTALRRLLTEASADPAARRSALDALFAAKDSGLPPLLQRLLSEAAMRGAALRALAAYDDAKTPAAILTVYSSLSAGEKRDALITLASRVAFAKPLVAAVGGGTVSRKDLSADVIRQLRSLKNDELERELEKVWGVARDSSVDKQKEIDKYRAIYRAGGSQPGDAVRGRAVFARVCQQCHTLFEVGGKVGPDLTGSNRSDLDYILQNMVDPNAVIPNDYRASTLETKDDRTITGIVSKQEDKAVTVLTANEILVIPAGEIKSLRQSDISMMPEGLLANLADQEVRDLIYYLNRPAQVPLLATPETLVLFFNGKDLSNWDGDPELWKVEDGQIVGHSTAGLKRNEFLKNQMVIGDFRLVCQVKLTPNQENSGLQFRSETSANSEVKGYQADAGAGWWGKLYEEQGRGLLWDKSGEEYVRSGDWNTYEVVAIGHQILTAINGHPCVNLTDPKGASQGIIALQLHAGGPMEVRFKDFQLELSPKPHLATVKN